MIFQNYILQVLCAFLFVILTFVVFLQNMGGYGSSNLPILRSSQVFILSFTLPVLPLIYRISLSRRHPRSLLLSICRLATQGFIASLGIKLSRINCLIVFPEYFKRHFLILYNVVLVLLFLHRLKFSHCLVACLDYIILAFFCRTTSEKFPSSVRK